jgi:hypothetical protein
MYFYGSSVLKKCQENKKILCFISFSEGEREEGGTGEDVDGGGE